MRLLHVAEGLFVASFVGLATATLTRGGPTMPGIDLAALATGPTEEYWVGLFMQGQHVGYGVSRESASADGGRIFQQQSAFKLAAMGEVQQIVAAGTAVTGPDGRVRRFDFLLSAPTVLSGRGAVSDGAIHLEIVQGGEARTLDIPVDEAPALSQTLGASVRGRTLTPGDTFEVPTFDPITLSNTMSTITVEAPELLPNGETAFWLRTRFGGLESRRLVDKDGGTLREEAAFGLSSVRMTREEAMAVEAGDPPDMVALSAVQITGKMPVGRHVAVRVSGVEMTRIPSEPPLQTVVDDVVTVDVPLVLELPTWPVSGDGDTEATLSLPANHPEIVARAKAVVGDAPDRLTAARRLYDFVHSYVQKVPTLGVPNGLEVLRSARGDCNEHTALYVSLARAVGIPSRIAAGLVYSARLGEAFYYHAWPEVRLGPAGAPWVPIDPTLGQFPADGSHLKIVTGDLDRQIEVMGLIGRIRLDVLEAR